jgi:hypothetical protein
MLKLKNMFKKIKFLLCKNQLYIIVGLNVIVFAFLLLRNPFSDRTLIPNFEPYPDTIHYVTPARSFLLGKGLKIYRNGYGRNPSVSPLYSLVLIPLYAINYDVRVFYFTNVILSFISFFLFFKILKKITKNIYIIGLCLFLYVTNYYIYWYPTLAMSENLILPLFLLGVYLLLTPVSIFATLLAGIVGISFYGTKYACAPLTASYLFLYYLKIFIGKDKLSRKIFYLTIPVISLIIFSALFLDIGKIFGTIYQNISLAFINPLISIFNSSEKITNANFDNAPFSKFYLVKYFPRYLKAIVGYPERFLWDNTPIVNKLVGIGGLTGLILNLFRKKYRFLCLSLIILLFSSIYFIASFYSFDMRFIYHALPIMIIGFALFLSTGDFRINKTDFKHVFNLIILGLFLYYLLTNAIRFKKQIMLNIKYRETPWYYVAVIELNKYFNKPVFVKTSAGNKKPVVISALNPFYIDYFTNGNYDLLPLSSWQDFFRKSPPSPWGENDYTNLIALYRLYINRGHDVYVHNSGLGNVGNLNASFNDIKENLGLEKVADGCYDSCNIYRVSLKD